MDWPKAKTSMIVLLLFINLVLIAFLSARAWSGAAETRRESEALLSLLREAGLEVSSSALSDETAYVCDIPRDSAAELTAVTALNGGAVTMQNLGGGSFEMTGAAWSAHFRADATFSCQPNFPVPTQDPEAQCARWLRAMGFWMALEEPVFEPTTAGLHLQADVNGLPLWGAGIDFVLEDGALTSFSGRWPLGTPQITSRAPCKTAGWCLLSLASGLSAQGVSPGALVELSLGYNAELISTDVLRLTPFWRADLDSGRYYINAMTGQFFGSLT